MITCDKSSCDHCEKIFDSKNKLHNHIRNHEYQKSLFSKSDIVIKTALIKLFIAEKNAISDINIVKKRITRFVITHLAAISFFAAKSISSHKFNLSTLASVEKTTIIIKLFLLSTNSSFIYRAISSLSFIYKSYKKPYLTIANLYIRYALLNKPPFTSTHIITIFSIIFMQNLYEKFYDKKKRIISNKILNSPLKQHATRQNLEHVVFERFEFIRYPKNAFKLHFSISSKSIAQGLTVQ